MDFNSYLNRKLKELNLDESVFKPYIVGILEGEEPDDEKIMGLSEVLGNEEIVEEILSKWNLKNSKNKEEVDKLIDVDTQLSKLLELQKMQTMNVQKKYTPEELKIKEQILSQYSQTSVSELEEEGDKKTSSSDDEDLIRNTNKADVAAAAKARREQAKTESLKKKEKDKEDLKKQKQIKEEKKEKRKTVKSEKRR